MFSFIPSTIWVTSEVVLWGSISNIYVLNNLAIGGSVPFYGHRWDAVQPKQLYGFAVHNSMPVNQAYRVWHKLRDRPTIRASWTRGQAFDCAFGSPYRHGEIRDY